MSDAVTDYAVYYTVATDSFPVGYVWNRVLWDGATGWAPPSGSAVVADAANTYPIGSTYTAPSA